ncbi:MAG: MFS transporter [Pyrodictiaceae archaeon]
MRNTGSRNLIALTVYALFRGFTVGGYQALYSAYMKTLGYSMASIGAAVTASSLIAALVAPGFGVFIDILGAKLATLVTGLIALLAVGLLSVPSPGYSMFIASYMSFMLAFVLGQPSRSTLLAKSISPERYGYYFALITLAFSASRAVGPLVTGWIALHNYSQAFQVMTLSTATGLSAFYMMAREPERQERGKGRTLNELLLEAYHRTFKPRQELAKLYLFLVLDRSGWSLWFPMLSAYFKALGHSEEEIGLFYTMTSLVQTISSIPLGKLADKAGAVKVLASSEAMGTAAVILLAEPRPIALLVTALTLIGLSIAAWIPAYNKLVAQLARGRLGETYASANAVRSIASIPAPILGGLLYQSLGPQTPFIASALVLALATLYARTLAPADKTLNAQTNEKA